MLTCNKECYLFRYEREYCIVDGDWICLRFAGLLTSDSRFGIVQRCVWSLRRSSGPFESYIQVSHLDCVLLKEANRSTA